MARFHNIRRRTVSRVAAFLCTIAVLCSGVDAQPRLCPDAGWTMFRNSCGISIFDIEWKHNLITQSGIDKICICTGDKDEETWQCTVPPQCEIDVLEYLDLFDTCPFATIEIDFNYKVAVSMKDALFDCKLKNGAAAKPNSVILVFVAAVLGLFASTNIVDM